MKTESGDSDELEALFDSIVQGLPPQGKEKAAEAPPAASAPSAPETEIHEHIGQLTRQLHDTLRELGYDKALENAVGRIPDTRDRLNYISTLTEQAAFKTLNAVEAAKPFQDQLSSDAAGLSSQWQALFERQLDVDQFKELVHQTRAYLSDVPAQAAATNAKLVEIIMAQDYQDLTGQVIKKLADTVQQLENQLVGLLIESMPDEKRKEMESSLLNGPVINSEGRTDIVTSQAQVDDLLESLGF